MCEKSYFDKAPKNLYLYLRMLILLKKMKTINSHLLKFNGIKMTELIGSFKRY